MFNFHESRNDGIYVDYNILLNDEKVGILQTVKHDNYIFGRQIHILECFQRNGYGTKIIEQFVSEKGSFRFTIATVSNSAVKFWEKYLCNHKNIHIKGETYELKK